MGDASGGSSKAPHARQIFQIVDLRTVAQTHGSGTDDRSYGWHTVSSAGIERSRDETRGV